MTKQDRLERRLKLAETVCQELRHVITAKVNQQDWSRLVPMLHKWMDAAPKNVKYEIPHPTR